MTAPTVFAGVLSHGVGSAKAFGFGLVSVPLAKAPFVRPIEISTPLVATLLLN